MKKLLAVILLAVLLAGCATAHITTTATDGATCKADFTSVYKDLGAVQMAACGASGNVGTSVVDSSLMPVLMSLINAYSKPAAALPAVTK